MISRTDRERDSMTRGETYYEGNFVEGKFDGEGKSFYKNGNVFFLGEFKNNFPNGKGKFY